MIKKLGLILLFALLSSGTFSQSKVSDIISESSSTENTISALKNLVQNGSKEEKFEAAEVLALLQEQFGEYTDASLYYTTAASLVGTQSAKGQNLLLGAVRCALLVGDVSRADFLLSTAISVTTDMNAKATANLYAVWSWIIKAENKEELEGPIGVLKSYVTLDSMKSVRPSILLILYHLTDEKTWAEQLQLAYPNSPEAAVSKENAKMYPSPFWFFSTIKN